MRTKHILILGSALGVADVLFNKRMEGFGDKRNYTLMYAAASVTALGLYFTLKGRA